MEELAFRGVYRLSPDGKKLELLVADIYSPNGLAFSPDEKMLYVADTELSRIYAFDVSPNGTLKNRRIFANILGGPDGMKVDVKGNLYVTTGMLAVRVYDRKGDNLGAIDIPETTRNCAFGGAENRTLFVTAGRSVYRIQLKVQGAPVALFLKAR
jgi:gluconolactonase